MAPIRVSLIAFNNHGFYFEGQDKPLDTPSEMTKEYSTDCLSRFPALDNGTVFQSICHARFELIEQRII